MNYGRFFTFVASRESIVGRVGLTFPPFDVVMSRVLYDKLTKTSSLSSCSAYIIDLVAQE